MNTARFLLNTAQKQVVQAGKSGINAIDLNLSDKGIAQIAIAVKAGTRHQINDNVAYTLAMCKGNTSESHTEFLQIQQLERAGAEYSHSVGRDHIVYTLKCGPRLAAEMFSDVVLPGLFCNHDWQWEVTEKEHNMKKILEHLPEKEKLLDTLYSVSFKSGGLEKSNLPAAYRLGKGAMRRTDFIDFSSFYWPIPDVNDRRVQSEEVTAYRDMCFTHDNITIFTSGFEDLEAQAINDSVAAYFSGCLGVYFAEKTKIQWSRLVAPGRDELACTVCIFSIFLGLIFLIFLFDFLIILFFRLQHREDGLQVGHVVSIQISFLL